MLTEDAEVIEVFNRIARQVGARVFGVEIGVDTSGDRLIFVDENGDPVLYDGVELIAATREEVVDKRIDEFPMRALRAAGIAKYYEIERLRTP